MIEGDSWQGATSTCHRKVLTRLVEERWVFGRVISFYA